MKNKRGQIVIIGIILLAVASIIGLFVSGNIYLADITGGVGTGGYIERPIFKYIKCEAVSDLKYSTPYTTISAPEWVVKPSITNLYNVKVTAVTRPFAIGNRRLKYSICNSRFESLSNCRIYDYKQPIDSGITVDINNVKSNEYVFISYQAFNLGWIDYAGLQYQIGFIPYGLREYDVLSGSPNPINPNDCTIPNIPNVKDQVLSTDAQKASSYVSPYTNQNVFQPEEVRWYVSGYVSSAAPSFQLNYNGKNAWCRSTGTSGEVYRINSITTTTGSYKIASPDYSDYLGTVNCCPKSTSGDKVCNDAYQWITIAGSQCSSFQSCGSPNPIPYSTQKTIQYYCDNGYCKSTINNVQCASDYDCKDANKVCDLKTFTCVNANVNLQGQVINTIPDSKIDCEAKGGKWITQTTQEKSIWNYLGIGEPKVIVTEYCDMGGGFNWYVLIWIAGGIIVLILLWKTGVWKRVIPLLKALPLFIKAIIVLILIIIIIAVIPR